ncbi:DUF1616 domain-containing protein [Natrinema hispanicum]|uniref:Uncharacterized membrane protein n=1 Tax=Natrinema hispanicum TaxID=392421 RepID=A0A1I0IKU6_9EURY|nr:DUF1616 domain-containing protein [Natrinema hispanicum]SDD39977.1 Uncharacterized membrane protein [Natrinema hispanicum]SET97001.1 Uncharacterized membrane protein [Natrinema hispanicum]
MKGLPFQPVSTLRRRSKRLATVIPTDLIGVAGFTVVATVVLVVANVSSPVVRAAVGFPFLFLVPGYVTVATLFPRATPVQEPQAGRRRFIQQTQALTDIERGALSFGLSFAVLPLLGLVIAATPWGFTGPVVGSAVACFSIVGTSLATARRLSVPPVDRYRVRFGRRLEAAHTAVFGAKSTLQVAINVVLVLSMVLAVTTVGYALVSPQEGEQYTSLRLLTENESGELVASGYPPEIEPNESVPFVVGVENQEQREMTYTVVVQEQRFVDGELVERTELQRTDMQVNQGTTDYVDQTVTPTTEEGTVRIAVLLYPDGTPETPTFENAYRNAYFWTTVAETDSTVPEGGSSEDETDSTDNETESSDTDDGIGDPFDGIFDDDVAAETESEAGPADEAAEDEPDDEIDDAEAEGEPADGADDVPIDD